MIPTLSTERLTLRPPVMADFEAFAELLASPRSIYIDGPQERSGAWDMFSNDIAQWHLRGFGGLIVEADGVAVGGVAVTQPPRFPEVELGWVLYDGFEGRGYASEAATALRAHVFATSDLSTLVSYIDPDNAASIAVATRLGATPDATAKRPEGDACLVYRHQRPEVMQ